MKSRLVVIGELGAALVAPESLCAQQTRTDQMPLQYFGKSVRGVPLAPQ